MASADADEIGVSADAILFGQTTALNGPTSVLGQSMQQGLRSAFSEINANGGIHGRKLKLISRDDGYDPSRAVEQTLKLIDDDKIFALIGVGGTPTALATAPIAAERHIPFIGPFSGSEALDTPQLANVVNIRAGYSAEAEAWVKHLTEDLHVKRIAIFYQNDSFGRDGLAGLKTALARRGLELTAEGTFERNTKVVGSAFRLIRRTEPDAVVLVGTYTPCAEFIKLAHKSNFNPTFIAVSYVGANVLAKELGPDGRGVIVSQVVPFPWDTRLRLVADYQAALHMLYPGLSPDFISLEGYLSGRLVGAALEMVGPEPTREGLLRIIAQVGQFDIGGYIVRFGAQRRANPPKIFLTEIQADGSFKPVKF